MARREAQGEDDEESSAPVPAQEEQQEPYPYNAAERRLVPHGGTLGERCPYPHATGHGDGCHHSKSASDQGEIGDGGEGSIGASPIACNTRLARRRCRSVPRAPRGIPGPQVTSGVSRTISSGPACPPFAVAP